MATWIRPYKMSLHSLRKKRIVVLGYGSQGRAQALNLKESGCDVVIGLRPRSRSIQKVKKDKLTYRLLSEVSAWADIIVFLIPDETQAFCYQQYIQPTLKPGASLVFAHGLNITFHKIVPRKDVNVFMIAPKGPGTTLRAAYVSGQGLPAMVSVYQDATGDARKIALAYAYAIGCAQKGLLETTFREETVTDLFGEQTVLCGGVVQLMLSSFETLVKNGLSPEAAYFECFHELKFIVDLIHEQGISGMIKVISKTAHYGGMTRGKRLITKDLTDELQKIYHEIDSGQFAEEWIDRHEESRKLMKNLSKELMSHMAEKSGSRVREKIGY